MVPIKPNKHKNIKHHSDLLNEEAREKSKQGLNSGESEVLETDPAHTKVIDEIINGIQKDIDGKIEFKLNDKHKEKIRIGLEKPFSSFNREELNENKKFLIEDISKDLIKNRTWWTKAKNLFGIKSYKISSDKIKEIATRVNEQQQQAKAEAKKVVNNMSASGEHTPQSEVERKLKKMGGRSVM